MPLFVGSFSNTFTLSPLLLLLLLSFLCLHRASRPSVQM